MDKIFKLLNKYNKNYLYRQKTSKKLLKRYQSEFKKQGLSFPVKNDFDFIDFLVVKQSYLNMESIQNKFFEVKGELIELWDNISYQQKHFLLYLKLDPYLDTLPAFYIDEKRYFISYFDYLINAYYDHDMLLFENEAYRKFLYDYKKIADVRNNYDYLPLKSGFTDLSLIVDNDDGFVMYDKLMQRLYIYKERQQSVGLIKNVEVEHIKLISEFILSADNLALINYLIDNDLGQKRLIKRLKRLKRKMVK